MTRWAPFLGLTGIVLVLLLALARLSTGVVRDGDPDLSTDTHAGLGEPTAHIGYRVEFPTDEELPGEAPRADEPPGDPAVDSSPATPHREPASGTSPTALEHDRVALSTGMLLANVALTQGLVGLAIAAGLWWFDVPGSALGITPDPWIAGLPAVGLGLAFGLALWLGNEAVAGIADAVGAGYDEAMRAMLAPDTVGGWGVLLGLVLPTVAVVEELLFRGALIGVFAAGLDVSPWLLAIVSSVAFALGHGAQGRAGIAVTGLLGFVLAAGYVLSGSLLVVVVAHYVVNAMEFVVHEALGLGRLAEL